MNLELQKLHSVLFETTILHKMALFYTFKVTVFDVIEILEIVESHLVLHSDFQCQKVMQPLGTLRMKRQMFKYFHGKNFDLIDCLKYPRERHSFVLCHFTKSTYYNEVGCVTRELIYSSPSFPHDFCCFLMSFHFTKLTWWSTGKQSW